VMVQTVPPMGNVEVSVDGVRSRTDASGVALVTVEEPGNYELSIRSESTDPDARVSFALWSDGSTAPNRVVDVSSFTFLQAGFSVSGKVDFRILDDAGRPFDRSIDSIAIVDNTGRERPLQGDTASWVPANRLVSESDELTSQPLSWRIARVVVEGKPIDRIDAAEYSAGEGLWSVRLDPDSARSGVAEVEDDESGGGAGPINYLYPIIVAILLGGTAVMILARRRAGRRSSRWSVASRWARLGRVLRVARPKKKDLAAPLKLATVRLRRRLQRGSTRPTTELLRVRLKSGHTIEGWTDPDLLKDREALRLVSVTRVLDSGGQPIPFQPCDAFVLRSRIASLKILMTSEDGPLGLVQPEDEARVIDLREQKDSHAR
jgi:hypothetical protein